MTMIAPARRRQADDFERLLSGGRASTPEAARDLAPLADLARSLVPVQHAPSDDFRAALRAQLVAEAAARVPAPGVPAQQFRPSAPARIRQAVAAAAVASVVAGVGAAAASTQALPGDSLYGLKRQIENVQLDLARGDLGHGRERLEQADARLSEAEALTASEHGSDPATKALVLKALDEMDAAVVLGVDDLNQAYRETGDDEPLLVLERFVTEQRERLADLMQLLDPSLRARAEMIAERLAVLDQQVSALLGFPVDSARALAGQDLTASGDGWAVGRLVNRSAATATGTSAAIGDGGLGARGDRTTSSVGSGTGTGVGDVVDAVGDVSGVTDGGTTTDDGGLLDDVVDGVSGGGSTATAPSAPTPAPSPTVSVPLPSPPPVVTDPIGTVTSAVPLPPVPTTPACVPVPPLTSC
jgi:hypothetical protein